MSSILKRILKGHARPAVMRPVPMVPMAQHPARTQTVETLELRVRQALPPRPAFGDPDVGADATPRSLLMSVDRVRHMGDCKVAQLERELVMERLRTKELREQVLEMDARITVLLEAGNSELVEKEQKPLLQRVMEFAARREAREVVAEIQPQHADEARWWEDVFADESSKLTFLEVIGGEFGRGVIVIEGPPACGKTRLGEVLAGEGVAQPMEDERGLNRLIAADLKRPLFFDDISTCQPWYQGPALHASGTPLHSEAIIEALEKALENERPLLFVLAGPHIDLSPAMEEWATRIRLKGGAL